LTNRPIANSGIGYKEQFLTRFKEQGEEAALYMEGMAILALKAERPDFRIYVVDGINFTPEQLVFNLLDGAPSFGPVDKWREYIEGGWREHEVSRSKKPSVALPGEGWLKSLQVELQDGKRRPHTKWCPHDVAGNGCEIIDWGWDCCEDTTQELGEGWKNPRSLYLYCGEPESDVLARVAKDPEGFVFEHGLRNELDLPSGARETLKNWEADSFDEVQARLKLQLEAFRRASTGDIEKQG
jgi:hypothetical protein